MRHVIFHALTLTWFLVGLWLRFLAEGVLRGAAYDVLLVTVLASATFCVRNQQLVTAATKDITLEALRRSQVALNRSSVGAWAIIACGAELIQGLLKLATGKGVLGTFDPLDLLCYAVGAIMSFLTNRLLIVDARGSRESCGPRRRRSRPGGAHRPADRRRHPTR